MGIWYQDDKGKFHYTDKAELVKYHECLQELQLFKGEASFFADSGVDIRGILEKKVFINNEFENVLEKYRPYFFSIDAQYNISNDQTKLDVNINFVFKEGDIKTYILNLEL